VNYKEEKKTYFFPIPSDFFGKQRSQSRDRPTRMSIAKK
jgi:hypothetical protein